MRHFISTARKIVRGLPALLVLGAIVLAPVPAFANTQGQSGQDGDERGERPERTTIAIDTLLRISKAGLRDLSPQARRIRIGKTKGIYDARYLIRALQHAPSRTRILVERIENARYGYERKRIIRELAKANSRKFGRMERHLAQTFGDLRAKGHLINFRADFRYGQTSSDPQVDAAYRLQDRLSNQRAYLRLLHRMEELSGLYR